MAKFGLIGRDISYSFSRVYFNRKFEALQLKEHSYENFDIQEIREFPSVLEKNPELAGLNVTIPYKETIIPYLDKLHPEAAKIGAVNTIKIDQKRLYGYNTDSYGFLKALEGSLQLHHNKALVLGTGGASKAVAYVLKSLDIPFKYVSRTGGIGRLLYDEIDAGVIANHTLIINTTPLGTFPRTKDKASLPYQHISPSHLLFDLIYNPEKTAFLKEGEKRGAQIINGLKMLEFQAEKSWEIWRE